MIGRPEPTGSSAMRISRSLPVAFLIAFASAAAAQPPSIKPLVPTPRREQQQALGPAPTVPVAVRGVHDRAELAAFLDGVMAANLRDKHVAGATVAVVKDGALFYAKGYGYSNVDRRAPVHADRSLFRIGSTSKLFTWTAVMQLVEQGKISLDADVNQYLDFKIPATYPQPITMRHIMTHTPGRHLLVLLELRHRARRLHRPARLRTILRRLHRAAHSPAVRHDAHHHP